MSYPPFHFEGPVQVFTQDDLIISTSDIVIGLPPVVYQLGRRDSGILVRDFRAAPMAAAWLALEGHQGMNFNHFFNQPAWVEINTTADQVEIELHDGEATPDRPVLWLGVRRKPYGQRGLETNWEVLRPAGSGRWAYAALAAPARDALAPDPLMISTNEAYQV